MRYEFEDFTLDTDRRELRRRDRPIAVQPQVFDVLAYLIANRDRVVTRDALLDAVWSGRIVSESTLSSRINAARAAIDDSGDDQRLIRTVSRKGFRFVGGVPEESLTATSRPERSLVGDGLVPLPQLQVVTDATPRGAEPAASLALPDRPSIAVLPFQNLSGDPEQEYFADGMVEDIVTGLARIKWLFVIARNSSFAYKNRAVDVRQIGRELGVGYLLEGGVQKSGGRLRITAQLVDAKSGAHLWAEKFDGAIEDVFDLQDQIADRVAGIVEPSVQRSEIERSRRKRPESLDAYDLVLRALPHMQTRMPEGARRAIPFLEHALSLDSEYPAAHAFLGWCHEWCFTRGGFDEKDKSTALDHARRAIGVDTDDAAALAVGGWVIIVLTRERDAALNAIDRALALNPSCATAHYFAALVNSFAARTQAARSHATRALRLSPFDPSAFEAHLAIGIAAVGEGKYEEAAASFGLAAQINKGHSLLHFFQAIALALDGRTDEAAISLERGRELEPGFRVQLFTEFGMVPTIAEKFAQGARMLQVAE